MREHLDDNATFEARPYTDHRKRSYSFTSSGLGQNTLPLLYKLSWELHVIIFRTRSGILTTISMDYAAEKRQSIERVLEEAVQDAFFENEENGASSRPLYRIHC
jgi:hypothetical protein